MTAVPGFWDRAIWGFFSAHVSLQARGKRQRSWNQNSGSRLWVKQVARGRDGASWGHGPHWDGG